MNEKTAENYVRAIIFAAVIIGIGVGVMLASTPTLVFNHFEGSVISIIGLALLFYFIINLENVGYGIGARVYREKQKEDKRK